MSGDETVKRPYLVQYFKETQRGIFTMANKSKFDVIFVKQIDEVGKVVLHLADQETGDSAALTIHTRKFNEDTKKYDVDSETYENGLAKLKELGASSYETAGQDLNALAIAGALVVEAYNYDGVASLTERGGNYEQFEKKITNQIAKEIDGAEVITGKFSNMPGFRLNVGAKVQTSDGEKNIRISQLIEDTDDEDYISLKYITQTLQDLRDDLRNGVVDEARQEQVKNYINNLSKRAYETKVKAMGEFLKTDFDKFVESGMRIKGRLKMQSVGSGKDKNNFATLLIDPTDFVVEPELSEED